MANVVLTRTQFWSMIFLGAITLGFLAYSAYSGQEDRAIIKQDIGQVLGNISSVDVQQTTTLSELRQAETDREIRSNSNSVRLNNLSQEILETQGTIESERRNQTERLLPIFFRQFNTTDRIDQVIQNVSDLLINQRTIASDTRDAQQAISFDLAAMRNTTEEMRGYINFLRQNYNESMLVETYNEYATTKRMEQKIDQALNLLNATG